MTLIGAASLLLLSCIAAADDQQVLDTPRFHVIMIERCPEDVVGCDDVLYRGRRKRDGQSIELHGTAVMAACKDGVTPCHMIMYRFCNGQYEYDVYPEGNLTVRRGNKELVSENGEWK